jgi:hypothetical protein
VKKLELKHYNVEMENLKIEDVCRRLEESTQRAEFKQVQLEGSLLQAQESIDKYKKDAN